MVKKYLLPVVFLFIAMNRGVGQNVKRTTCTTPEVSISADYCTNPGEVILTASPASGVSYLWSTGETTQSITVDVVGNYSVEVTTNSGGCTGSTEMNVGQELVTNGDFTAGNVGFTSGYAYKADSSGYNMELYDDSGNNAYGVGTNGQNYHPSFWGKDHTNNTTGDRNFMLVNGHGSIVVWEETVAVEPNTNYYYSAWGMNINPSSPAQLQFEVNGVKIGTIADLNSAPKPSKNSQVNLNNWVRFYYGSTSGWNSGSATTAVIRIIDLNADLSGNDFGLDDISFATLSPFLIGPGIVGSDNQEVCPGTSIQSITYKVGSGGAPSITGLPPGVTSSFDGLNLTISGTPTTPGTYSYEVSTTGCTIPKTASGVITVKNPGVWTGAISTDWNNAGNWCCGSIPSGSTDVVINSGLTNYPVVTDSITGYCNNLSLETGASLIVSNGGILGIAGALSNSGTFDATDGTIEMNGLVAQSISGEMFSKRTIKNLVVSNTSPTGLSISSAANDTLNIAETLSFGDDSSKLNTGDNLTLLSNNVKTASVGIVGPGNSITGKVIVERYLNIGTGAGQHAKSWQFLSTPTIGQTVKESWMENGGTPANYGTQITGAGGVNAGFDLYSGTPSCKYYNSATNSWTGITNTNDSLYNSEGYMVFVRGDRSVTAFNQPPNNTTLRSKGTLMTGTLCPITAEPGAFTSIGNPYASDIDFTSISKDAGIEDKFYLWDPYLYGSFGLGGYQTFSSVNDWKPVPGATTRYISGVPNKTIESGQAFMVHASVAPGDYKLTFSESCKIDNNRNQNAARIAEEETSDKRFFNVSLFTGSGSNSVIADGNVVIFSANFSDKVDRNDAMKLTNSGENFGIKRDGNLLAIEARAPVSVADTIYYFMSNVSRRTYELRFAPVKMNTTGLEAYLFDNYLQTETPISLSDSSFVDFTITPDPASAASDRFKVFFRQMALLPVTLVSLTAKDEGSDILVTWMTENEISSLLYEVQTSVDGANFTNGQSIPAKNSGEETYKWVDKDPLPGYHYYRIKRIDENGKTTYSPVVKVYIKGGTSSMSVYPNPVRDGIIHLEFHNQPAGNYSVRILDVSGKVIRSKSIRHTAGSDFEEIEWHLAPAHGIYRLEVIDPNGEVTDIKLLY